MAKGKDKPGFVGTQFTKALARGQGSVEKYIKVLTDQNEEMIAKMNWIMEAQQAMCDNLKVTLKDPLED